MKIKKNSFIKNIDIILMLFIFSVLFILPILFTRENNQIAWRNVLKIWQDQVLLLPLFAINHWLLVPKLMLKKKYVSYALTIVILISISSTSYYFYDTPPARVALEKRNPDSPRNHKKPRQKKPRKKKAVPPYAELLFLSLVIVAVDTGLSFTKHWHTNEEDNARLEKETVQAQLSMLRNQISPHFFMNTLNNIYALIEGDKQRSRQAIMKLSKLMRYLLYENQNGKVLVSKEFEFIHSYVDLMKLRFINQVDIQFNTPDAYKDVEIPVLLFISYLENAFKYGASYQNQSFIKANFELTSDSLIFTCTNSSNAIKKEPNTIGGIGLKNSKKRLDLLYKDNYELKIHNVKDIFSVELTIPIL